MLVFHHGKKDAPPTFVQPYLDLVEAHLRAPWSVALVAYDDEDPGDSAFVSAAVLATTSTGLLADVSRHAGADVVLVRLRDSAPVPFEDLAVAKGQLDKDVLLAHAANGDNGDDRLPPLEDALNLLYEWTGQLPDDLSDPDFVAQLRVIADDFMAALPHGGD